MHKICSKLHIHVLTIHGNLPYGQQMALAYLSSICCSVSMAKICSRNMSNILRVHVCSMQFSCGNMYSKWMSVLYKYKLLKTLYLSKEIVDKSLRLIQKINMFNEL